MQSPDRLSDFPKAMPLVWCRAGIAVPGGAAPVHKVWDVQPTKVQWAPGSTARGAFTPIFLNTSHRPLTLNDTGSTLLLCGGPE